MSNLDDKLDDLSIWIEANRDVNPRAWQEDVWPEIKNRIKQVFTDEGYADMKKFQEMLNLVADMKYQTVVAPKKVYVVLDKKQKKMQELMTGQEWYARFESELINKVIPYKKKMGDDAVAMATRSICIDAAKRASNITEEDDAV